jgi:hypothetical protein
MGHYSQLQHINMDTFICEANSQLKDLLKLKIKLEEAYRHEAVTRLKLQGLRVEILNSFVNFTDYVKSAEMTSHKKIDLYKKVIKVVRELDHLQYNM